MPENTSTKNLRSIGIDFIKAISVFGVIVIHIAGPLFYAYPVGSMAWNITLFWGVIVRASVPLFLMCSGALLLDPQKHISLKKLYLKTIPRIVAAMFFWGMLYKLYNLAEANALSSYRIFHAFKELLLFNHEYHFYYMHIILLVYVFLPITRVFVSHASEQILRYSLIVWVVLAIVYPTVNSFYPFNLLSGMIPQWGINMTYASIGYGILGYYLKKHPFKIGAGVILTALSIICVFAATYVKSMQQGYLYELFLGGMTIGIFGMACGIYTLSMRVLRFGNGGISDVIANIVTGISKGSFCIYLVHVFFINFFTNIGISAEAFSPILSIPALALLIFVFSFVIYLAVSKIPVLNKWII